MINCIIVDDESYAIDTLTDYIARSNKLYLLRAFNDPTEALHFVIDEITPELIFLDIDMPELSGLEIASLLPDHVAVIYVTAHADYALRAFDTNVYDFLLKPVSFVKFLKSIQKVTRMLEAKQIPSPDKEDFIFINPGIKSKLIKLDFNDIFYVEGLKNYVIIHVTGGKHITYVTMKEMEISLPQDRFIRIHKSYIINLEKLQSLDGNFINLSGDIQLPLGGSYKTSVLNFINRKSVRSKRLDAL